MSGPTDDEILKLAEQLNDGVLSIDNCPEDFHDQASDKQQILAAIAKINHITNNIRLHSHDESRNLKQGDNWAHLEIIKKIGQGGIGEVYCAYDPVLDSQVAVKFLNQRSQLYITELQFLDEARHMAKVRHPHVLAIHGATVDQNIPGYWSDYLDGQLLSDRLQEDSIAWDLQLKYALHLCQAVKAIHNNQLVHGDIKASNVMIQPERGAILLDFGSSSSVTQTGNEHYVQQASPMAMAPEQFDGQAANQSTDIFSLGLVFWQISANYHPLQGLELAAIKKQTAQLKNIQAPPGPKAWKQLIDLMVAANPKKRPDIHAIEKAIKRVINRPAQKAKQVAFISVLLLAAGITTISLYSNYKTTQAQQATEAMNTLLSDILMKSSPIEAGKDVLLIDVLTDAEQSLLNNQKISKQQQTSSLMQLVRTYRHQGKHQMSINLASKLLSEPGLSGSDRLDLLMQKSAGLNENKNYQDSEALLLEAIQIKPETDQDATAQLSALITLIYTYNESYQLEKVPPLIAQAKTLWRRSAKKEAALANIYLVEGNHYEIKEQYQKAYELYKKSVENFIIYYGEKNLDVLIAEGAAATVLTYQKETLQEGIDQLETVVSKMTDFLGADHTSTLIARINMADAYAQTEQYQQAIDAIVPHMPLVEKAYGKTGGMTINFKNMIANYYLLNGNHDVAKKELQEIIDIEKQKHGPDSQQHLDAELSLVLFLTETQQLTAALTMAVDIQRKSKQKLADNSRITLDTEEQIIWIEHLLGDLQAADKMVELIQTMTVAFGADDPATLSAKKRLNEIRK